MTDEHINQYADIVRQLAEHQHVNTVHLDYICRMVGRSSEQLSVDVLRTRERLKLIGHLRDLELGLPSTSDDARQVEIAGLKAELLAPFWDLPGVRSLRKVTLESREFY